MAPRYRYGGESRIGGGLENVSGRGIISVEEKDKEEKASKRRGSMWEAAAAVVGEGLEFVSC